MMVVGPSNKEVPESGIVAQPSLSYPCELYRGSTVTELISGWNAGLIVETWSHGGVIATSIGLAVVSKHTCGRHVCIVPDEDSRTEYIAAVGKLGMLPEVIVGELETVVKDLGVIDFLVVDSRKNDFDRILKATTFGHRGAVLVCKNASSRAASGFRWGSLSEDGGARRIVRSVFLPVGNGLDIAHVAAADSGTGSDKVKSTRWIKRVDRQSGEEFVIRK